MDSEPQIFPEDELSDFFYRVIKDAVDDRGNQGAGIELSIPGLEQPDTQSLPPIILTEDIFLGATSWDDVAERSLDAPAPAVNSSRKSSGPQHARHRPQAEAHLRRLRLVPTTPWQHVNRAAIAAVVIVVGLIGVLVILRSHGSGSTRHHQVAIANTTVPTSTTLPSTTADTLGGAPPSDLPTTAGTTPTGTIPSGPSGPSIPSVDTFVQAPLGRVVPSPTTGHVTNSTGTVEATVPPTSPVTTVTPTTLRRPTSTLSPPPSYSIPSIPFTIPSIPIPSIPPPPTISIPTPTT